MGCCQGRVRARQPNRVPALTAGAEVTKDIVDKRYFSSRASNYLSEKNQYKFREFAVASIGRPSDELE